MPEICSALQRLTYFVKLRYTVETLLATSLADIGRPAVVSADVASYVSTETLMPALTPSELEAFPALEWSDVAPRVSPALRASLEKVIESQNGGALSLEESFALADSDGDDLLGLLVAADMLRSELAGNLVTYVVNRNINFTNVCFVGCKFCAFSRGPRESDAYFLSFDDVAKKTVEAWKLGATEVCIQGGHCPPSTIATFCER